LLQAAYTNENLKSVVIEFHKKSSGGQPGNITYRITLTNASISLISQYGGTALPDSNGNLVNNGNMAEEISLNFQNIVVENLIANTSATDDWK
jgi:type VI secretion system Hcp family effector